jgi:hypothetical protein
MGLILTNDYKGIIKSEYTGFNSYETHWPSANAIYVSPANQNNFTYFFPHPDMTCDDEADP